MSPILRTGKLQKLENVKSESPTNHIFPSASMPRGELFGEEEMNIKLCNNEDKNKISEMIKDLINYHRKLTNSPKEFWCDIEEAKNTFDEWIKEGKIYLILDKEYEVGFFYIKLGGNNAAWLEDLYIISKYRGKGFGKTAMKLLDETLLKDNITALFVDVIPRNNSAIEFYKEVGFDHLNMIQLRKNYDERLNKDEKTEVCGHKFIMY